MNIKKNWDAIWINGQIATFEEDYGLISNAAIAVKHGKIAWVGAMDQLPAAPDQLADCVHELNGKCLLPGLIDCHTHLVYAGNRYAEFEKRLRGMSYAQIAAAGGGIQASVQATRDASEDDLFQQSVVRAQALAAEGVTTLEIKSGYGLDLATESKMLRVAKRIGEELDLNVRLTFLGAHAVPVEFKNRPDDYIDLVCEEMLPALTQAQLIHQVDVFCEKIAFTLPQTERVFQAAQHLGLGIKCHAEQLSDMGASQLASTYDALSVDHLEFLSPDAIAALAAKKTVAVLLPGAFYFLREKQLPPIALLREHKVPIAIATDCNPGTSPVTSILLMLNMACVLFDLTPLEALAGVTKQAAAALGLQKSIGTLTVGKDADFSIWEIAHPAELVYRLGFNPLRQMIKKGTIAS